MRLQQRLHEERKKLLCHYCGIKRAKSWDHIIPKSRGGPYARWNLVPACGPCNAEKAAKFPTHDCATCRLAVKIFNGRKQQ